MKALRGKAIFVRHIRHLDADPLKAARKYAGWGFTWAAPMIMSGASGATNRESAFYRECHRLGVGVVPDWILPKPESWRERIGDFFAFVDQLPGIAAVMIDPEADWRSKPEEAELFARTFHEMAHARGLKVVLTTYAMPPANFPLEVFAQYADAGIAQTYSLLSVYGDAIFARSLERWRARGFADKPLILAGAFWEKYAAPEARTKTPVEWADFLSKVPPTPGFILWPNVSWGAEIVPLLQMFEDWNPRVIPSAAKALLLGLPFGEMIADAIFGG